jgi:hypothetical protein
MTASIPPPPSQRRHSIAETLRLVDAVNRLAFDPSLQPDDAMRRLRDLLNAHAEEGNTP